MLDKICVNRNCIHIFKICESIYATTKPSNCLKYVTLTYSPDLVDLTHMLGHIF